MTVRRRRDVALIRGKDSKNRLPNTGGFSRKGEIVLKLPGENGART